jgi:signal transduction histidine kinase
LLQKAFRFTYHGSEVELRACAIGDRIRIDVRDHCGGLAEGAVEKMFHPFMQVDADRTGLGLGLAISQSSVEANRGILSVGDLPESGRVFIIDLPRYTIPERTLPQRHSSA